MHDRSEPVQTSQIHPVVYRIFDADDRLIYIGATSNLEQRLIGHGSAAWWYPLLHRIETEPQPSMEDALAAELAAIHAEKPAFNLRGRGGRSEACRRLTDDDIRLLQEWDRFGGHLPVALRWVRDVEVAA